MGKIGANLALAWHAGLALGAGVNAVEQHMGLVFLGLVLTGLSLLYYRSFLKGQDNG